MPKQSSQSRSFKSSHREGAWEKILALPSELSQRRIQNAQDLTINRPHFQFKTPFGTIDYVRAGNPSGEVLLLIPGIPDQIYTFHRLIPHLSDDFDLLAISPPARGFSSYADGFDFHLNSFARFWKTVVDLFDLKNVTAVAHSFGFTEIIHAVLQFGRRALGMERIISLCGWSPALLPEPLPVLSLHRFLGSHAGTHFYRRLSNNRYFGTRSTLHRFLHRWLPSDELNELTHQYFNPWPKKEETETHYGKRILHGICRNVREHNRLNGSVKDYFKAQKSLLSHLRGIPFLAVGASHDQYLRGPQDEKPRRRDGVLLPFTDLRGLTQTDRLFRAFSRASGHGSSNRVIYVPDAGHMLPLEAPQETAHCIREFIKATPGRTLRRPSFTKRVQSYLRTMDAHWLTRNN